MVELNINNMKHEKVTGSRRLIQFARTHMATSKKIFVKTRFASTTKHAQWPVLLLLYTFALILVFNMMASVSNGKKMKSNGKRSADIDVSALRSRLDWDADDLPELCHQIMRKPQPLRKNCTTAPRIKGAPRCDPNHPMMFSQYGEDYYLYTRHFSKYKKPGVYLDIATNEPIQISNTYFFDRCLSWKGICVEANPKYFERIHRERSCALVPTCLSKHDGVWVEFAMSGPGSGIISTHRQGKNIRKHNNAVVRQKCVSVATQLERYGVTEVDYMNLDVEGHELEILKSFDWNNVLIKVISVEISSTTAKPIQDFLESRGFVKHDNEKPTGRMRGMPIYHTNHFYVHETVTFVPPLSNRALRFIPIVAKRYGLRIWKRKGLGLMREPVEAR